MVRKFTTVLALVLMSGSLAFAAQAPTNPPNTATGKSAAAHTAPSGSPSKSSTTSKSTTHHKKHHKKATTPIATSKPAAPKQ